MELHSEEDESPRPRDPPVLVLAPMLMPAVVRESPSSITGGPPTITGRILAPTKPRRSRPVRPRPSQLCLRDLLRISIRSWAASPVCTLARTLMHCSMRPTVSVMTWEESVGPRWMMVGRLLEVGGDAMDWKKRGSALEDVFEAARLRESLLVGRGWLVMALMPSEE